MPLIVSGTDSITLPVGTTAQRNATPVTGMYRLNSTTGTTEVYNGTNWVTESPVAGTAVASTSGTSITFTGIPAGVKRVTVLFSGVSTSGTAQVLVQIGAGSTTTTGYLGSACYNATGATTGTNSTGFRLEPSDVGITALRVRHGIATLANITGNNWCFSYTGGYSDANGTSYGGGSLTLAGTLDRVIITTSNGTDTFDAGSINILYE